jgi:transcriptional regulator with XRE-family HTH domain
MSLGGFIKQAREAKGWSQRELSRHSGVSISTVHNLEQGLVKTLRLETARLLARSLGVSVDQMADAAKESDHKAALAS